jgi:beta-aspartyl-peptidase (threonine type)
LRAAAAEETVRLTESDKHGTVGAVALDASGNLSAATSTGGRNNKLPGRVGDTPVVGAGTYADNASVAVSCTGEGEYFMRIVAAHHLAALVELKGMSVEAAAHAVIHERLQGAGGRGGLIALDRSGRVAMPFSTPGMYRGVIRANGVPVVGIFAE